MRNLIPSPLRSAWAFIGYALIFVVPLWKAISFLGDVNFVMGYVAPVGNVLATGWGTALLIIVGFGCLIYANYRQRSALSNPPGASALAENHIPTTEGDEAKAARERLERAAYQAKQENDSLRQRVRELEMMSPEEYHAKQEERRKRIEKWRAEIQSHMFARHPWGGSLFAHTETYSDMKPLLPPNVQRRYESQYLTGPILGSPRKIGKDGDRRVLLDEVSRIEKEWGVI